MISVAREPFPTQDARADFTPLWGAHGIEVRGRPFDLNFGAYERIEREGRLICIVAREYGLPVGYSWHYWYVGLHWPDRFGHDDLWYVEKEHRGQGIGVQMKRLGLLLLKQAGAVETTDLIRRNGPHTVMLRLGYQVWGTRWVKALD